MNQVPSELEPLLGRLLVKAGLSLTKLMISHDLLRSTVTNQIAFDQRDSKSGSNFERPMDRFCKALVSRFFSGFQIGNLAYHQF